MKVKYKLQYLFILLVPFTLFLTAFRFSDEASVTRLQLTQFLNEIVTKALPDAKEVVGKQSFVDLSSAQIKSVAPILETGIVCGFPDSSFRPEKPVRNHEVLWYLKKTLKFLESNAPDSEMTRLLSKLVGLGRAAFYENINSSFTLFEPEEHYENIAHNSILEKIKVRLGLQAHLDRKLTIQCLDSHSQKPVKHCFVAVAGNTYRVNNKGIAIIDDVFNSCKKKVEFLVSSPGYKTLRFKRDKMQNDSMIIRLTPARSQIVLTAHSQFDQKAIDDFSIFIDGKKQRKSIDGIVAVKPVECGYHNVTIEAEGFVPARKLVKVGNEVLKLKVLLDPV